MQLKHKLLSTLCALLLCHSCLVPPAPKGHTYKPQSDEYTDAPTLAVFSTPGNKFYFLQNVNLSDTLYIKSDIFENPTEYYQMNNSDHFGKEVKAFNLKITDGKYYTNPDYKSVSIKIKSQSEEKIIDYTLE
ncbi:hypothetical protein M0G43_09245 [Subsaxibacter sp. CAU 1640]|uniref:hypothetical protein n=1 Tax=Subsaxibacter sp. CAU 1640 TaxID=2933271 RepID=UPI002002C3FA|nr:hypothetical protein [Subsaxibacter sp. CAU 1640]MCK7590758.1 hypothetical protein [Subsaxibacter sp. CAU 1640]